MRFWRTVYSPSDANRSTRLLPCRLRSASVFSIHQRTVCQKSTHRRNGGHHTVRWAFLCQLGPTQVAHVLPVRLPSAFLADAITMPIKDQKSHSVLDRLRKHIGAHPRGRPLSSSSPGNRFRS